MTPIQVLCHDWSQMSAERSESAIVLVITMAVQKGGLEVGVDAAEAPD